MEQAIAKLEALAAKCEPRLDISGALIVRELRAVIEELRADPAAGAKAQEARNG